MLLEVSIVFVSFVTVFYRDSEFLPFCILDWKPIIKHCSAVLQLMSDFDNKQKLDYFERIVTAFCIIQQYIKLKRCLWLHKKGMLLSFENFEAKRSYLQQWPIYMFSKTCLIKINLLKSDFMSNSSNSSIWDDNYATSKLLHFLELMNMILVFLQVTRDAFCYFMSHNANFFRSHFILSVAYLLLCIKLQCLSVLKQLPINSSCKVSVAN